MTKDQFKEYICNQIDLMQESELNEFSKFIQQDTQDESITQELIVIKGEFKKLTKLVSSVNTKVDKSKIDIELKDLEIFINFDKLLKNSQDAIISLPKASIFNYSKMNRAIYSLQNGFSSVEDSYKNIISQIGLEKSAIMGEKFDANYQEVVEVIYDKNIDNELIIEVIEEGFIYKKNIINYAKVKVNRWI